MLVQPQRLPTRDFGQGPKTANESDQKQFHKKKESVEVQGGDQSQSDGECTVARHTKKADLALPFVFVHTIRTANKTKTDLKC